MKKVLLSLLLVNYLSVFSQTTVTDKYNFPFKQGSKELEQSESITKRITSLQIPDSTLYSISTEGLIETNLAFPYLSDIFFYNDYQKGFEALLTEFNGLRELLHRSDLVDKLLLKYKDLSSDIVNNRVKNDIDKGRHSFYFFFIELIFAQDTVLESLSKKQEQELFALTIEQNKLKSEHADIFGKLNFISTNLLYAKKAVKDIDFKIRNNDQKTSLAFFLREPRFIDRQVASIIENYIINKYKK